jgi:hypothetical protein
MFIDTVWSGAGGGDGVHYLGQNRTTGGGTPAFGSRHDTSNPSGWPDLSPNGPTERARKPPRGSQPLATPPSGTR